MVGRGDHRTAESHRTVLCTEQGYKAKSAQENACERTVGEPGAGFEESVPVKSHSSCLIPPARRRDGPCVTSSSRSPSEIMPGVLLGAGYMGTLCPAHNEVPSPEGEQVFSVNHIVYINSLAQPDTVIRRGGRRPPQIPGPTPVEGPRSQQAFQLPAAGRPAFSSSPQSHVCSVVNLACAWPSESMSHQPLLLFKYNKGHL